MLQQGNLVPSLYSVGEKLHLKHTWCTVAALFPKHLLQNKVLLFSVSTEIEFYIFYSNNG
jgi:hypothetical protein